MSWEETERLAFVRGYLVGVRQGYTNGCFAFDDLTRPQFSVRNPADTPVSKCLSQGPHFSKVPDYYEAQITAYYERYVTDRNLNLEKLLYSLSDSQGKSLEQIHEMWTSGLLGRH